MLAVNACCAETDSEADRLRASVEAFYLTGDVDRRPLLSVDDAVAALGGVPEPTEVEHGVWPRHLSGEPGRLASMLEQLATEAGADEVMVQDLVADPVDRIRSYQLLAAAFERVTA